MSRNRAAAQRAHFVETLQGHHEPQPDPARDPDRFCPGPAPQPEDRRPRRPDAIEDRTCNTQLAQDRQVGHRTSIDGPLRCLPCDDTYRSETQAAMHRQAIRADLAVGRPRAVVPIGTRLPPKTSRKGLNAARANREKPKLIASRNDGAANGNGATLQVFAEEQPNHAVRSFLLNDGQTSSHLNVDANGYVVAAP